MSTEAPSLLESEIPPETQRLLSAAADHWEDTARSQPSIEQAIADPQAPLDVLIAAYRYFFYKNNNVLALQVAQRVMQQIRDREALPQDWQELEPILSDRPDDDNLRLYRNAYAAAGLLLARLGDLEEAKTISERIRTIDERRESCAATVFDVLTRPADEED